MIGMRYSNATAIAARMGVVAAAIAFIALIGLIAPPPADPARQQTDEGAAAATGTVTPTAAAPGPAAVRPSYVMDPDNAAAYVYQLARQSGGDYARLNEEDKHYLDHVTQHHGPQLLRMIARQKHLHAPSERPK